MDDTARATRLLYHIFHNLHAIHVATPSTNHLSKFHARLSALVWAMVYPLLHLRTHSGRAPDFHQTTTHNNPLDSLLRTSFRCCTISHVSILRGRLSARLPHPLKATNTPLVAVRWVDRCPKELAQYRRRVLLFRGNGEPSFAACAYYPLSSVSGPNILSHVLDPPLSVSDVELGIAKPHMVVDPATRLACSS